MTGLATDTIPISGVEWSHSRNPGSWNACSAQDSAYDSTREPFRCTFPYLSDSQTIFVRSFDENGVYMPSSLYGSHVFWPPSQKAPDLLQNSGGIIPIANLPITVLVEANTFGFDVNVSHASYVSSLPEQILGSYWSIGRTYELWFISAFNGAKVLPQLYGAKLPIITLTYRDEELYSSGTKSYFSEKLLRVAYSPDRKRWTILRNTVIDTKKNSISFIHPLNGYFRIVAYAGKNVSDRETASNQKTPEELKTNDEAALLLPSPKPNPSSIQIQQPTNQFTLIQSILNSIQKYMAWW